MQYSSPLECNLWTLVKSKWQTHFITKGFVIIIIIIIIIIIWPSNRNEYQEYFLEAKGGRWVGLITQPPSCADCLEIWDPNHLEPSEPLQALTELLYLCFFLSRVCAVKNLSILDVKVIVTGSLLPTHLQKSHIILWELATVWKFNVVFMVFDTIVHIVSLTQRIPKLVS